MSDRIRHRGPDDSGYYLSYDGIVGLSFRRLSIIDLSAAGHQPMTNKNQNVWIVFNGEIYNYKKIKDDLIKLGYQFNSKTDTEVILNSYSEWGEKCVDKFSGMFSFVIWDARENKLFAARDHTGIKPFFYYYDGNRFVFGSEIKAILNYPKLSLDLEETAIYDFLTYLYIPTPKTLYKNIFKLPPGHTLSFQKNKLIVEKYWDINPFDVIKISENDAITEIQRLIEESVKSQLMSDVPLGVFLSGGIDSSIVSNFAQKNNYSRLNSFSIGFDDLEHSELNYANLVSKAIGTNYNEKIVTQEMFAEIGNSIINQYDEPFGDSSAIPTYFVSKFAREQVTVALTGDGGDEVFGGYNWYQAWMRRENNYNLNYFTKGINSILSKIYPTNWPKHEIFLSKSLTSIPSYAYLMGGIMKSQKKKVLHDKYLKKFEGYDDYWYYKKYWQKDLDPFTKMQYLDLKTYLHDDILTKVDRASMSISLEARVPLLDHKLIEFVFSLPHEIRNKHFENKYILKLAMKDFLPEKILNRPKKGFSVPQASWLPMMERKDLLPSINYNDYEILNPTIFLENNFWLRGNKLWQIKVLNHWLDRIF